MKVVSIILSIFVSLLFFTSCNNSNVDTQAFGEVKYYPDFLWVDENLKPVTKTFCFDFSEDSKNDDKLYAEFAFVDNEGNVISPQVMQVLIDGELLSDNKFKVYSKQDSCRVTFQFTPSADGGKYQGYLKLVGNYDLDRLDSQVLTPGQNVDVFQWTLYYNKCMNPLAKILMWIFIAIVICLMLWFLIIRPSVYPHFGKFSKSILIKQNDIIVGQLSFAFTGARKVVFYDKKVKQSIWSRIFIGEIKTYINPLFKTKLTFTPKRRNATAFGTGYSANPNPIPRSGVATINNHFEKISITLS